MNRVNQLTAAEAERLVMLAEECAEVIQAVGKILRHGYASHHPDDPSVTNRTLLLNEVADVSAVLLSMHEAGDGGFLTSLSKAREVWQRKLRFAHYQDN